MRTLYWLLLAVACERPNNINCKAGDCVDPPDLAGAPSQNMQQEAMPDLARATISPGLDAGAPDLASKAPVDLAISGGAKRVFVTNSVFLPSAVKEACQNSADAAGLGGTWVPWLSDAGGDAIDRVRGNGPWNDLNGDVVFANHAQLATQPMNVLHTTELGTDAIYQGYVWTGTLTGGRASGSDCQGWTSNEKTEAGTTGTVPLLSDPSEWTDYQLINCGEKYYVYCFEQ
jgi:hypothetical protein